MFLFILFKEETKIHSTVSKQDREIKVISLELEFCDSHTYFLILFYYHSSLEYNVAH